MSRQAILVVGMHRSGTSAVAGLLAQCGARAPDSLMPADANNPQGYWESLAFHDFHERLLRLAGTRWNSWTVISPEWLSSAAERLRAECLGLLQSDFHEAPLLVLKDPRMCRLLPFWLPVMTAAGISASVVLVVRNPHDVARSLERRDGLSRTTALLMWLRHTLEAEFQSRPIRRTIVRSEDLPDHWPDIARQIGETQGITWPARSEHTDHEISDFVRSGYRQRDVGADDGGAPQSLLGLLDVTQSAMSGLRNGDSQVISAATDALDRARAMLDQIESMVGDISEQFEAQRAESKSTQSALQTAEAALLQSRAALAESNMQRNQAEAEAIARQEQLAALEADRARLATEISSLHDSWSWRITAPLRTLLDLVTAPRRP